MRRAKPRDPIRVPRNRNKVQTIPAKSRFLEPIYLNDQMTLNCAAYLFEGVSTQTESSLTTDKTFSAGGSLGMSILGKWLNPLQFQGDVKANTQDELRTARQHTLGAIHMSVLDQLRMDGMIRSITSGKVEPLFGGREEYVEIDAVLKPTDYLSLISTLRIICPLASQIFENFGDKILASKIDVSFSEEDIRQSAVNYGNAIALMLDRLEQDYLTAGQIEMVMWSTHSEECALGVVDLNVGSGESAQLRARLSGGRYKIIGKVTREVGRGQTLSLMEKTALAHTLELLHRLSKLGTDPDAPKKFSEMIAEAEVYTTKLLRFSLPGPALRVAAMSVCM